MHTCCFKENAFYEYQQQEEKQDPKPHVLTLYTELQPDWSTCMICYSFASPAIVGVNGMIPQ